MKYYIGWHPKHLPTGIQNNRRGTTSFSREQVEKFCDKANANHPEFHHFLVAANGSANLVAVPPPVPQGYVDTIREGIPPHIAPSEMPDPRGQEYDDAAKRIADRERKSAA